MSLSEIMKDKGYDYHVNSLTIEEFPYREYGIIYTLRKISSLKNYSW